MFKPCIDIHDGTVKQIVGGTLSSSADAGGPTLVTNFVSSKPADEFARLYKRDSLVGGHVIMLGPSAENAAAAKAALSAFPGGMQIGGGITPSNAAEFIQAGASHVIVTSFAFRNGALDMAALQQLVDTVGRDRLVLDLSCRRRKRRRVDEEAPVEGAAATPVAEAAASVAVVAPSHTIYPSTSDSGRPHPPDAEEANGSDCEYAVVTDRWQRWTRVVVNPNNLAMLGQFCAEFLVHGVDVEGLRSGIEDDLVELLGKHSPIPVTYAGGVRSIEDLERVRRLGSGRVSVSVGSALDIFGGSLPYDEVVAWHRRTHLQCRSPSHT